MGGRRTGRDKYDEPRDQAGLAERPVDRTGVCGPVLSGEHHHGAQGATRSARRRGHRGTSEATLPARCFGELTATEAKAHGIVGVVIDGAVRNTDCLSELQFPAFRRAVTPRVDSNRRVGATQMDVVCGGVVVHPGDLIVADQDGVAIIHHERLAEVVAAVQAVDKEETHIRTRMQQGEQLPDVQGLRSLIYPTGT
jgi:hypothetical protein